MSCGRTISNMLIELKYSNTFIIGVRCTMFCFLMIIGHVTQGGCSSNLEYIYILSLVWTIEIEGNLCNLMVV